MYNLHSHDNTFLQFLDPYYFFNLKRCLEFFLPWGKENNNSSPLFPNMFPWLSQGSTTRETNGTCISFVAIISSLNNLLMFICYFD